MMKNQDGMAGEKGMSPRKAMAAGEIKTGNFGARSFESLSAGRHPDHAAGTGMKGAMGDGERASGPGVHYSKTSHPAQAAPGHGPSHPGGYGAGRRTGKL